MRVRDRVRYGRLVADVVLPDGRILNHDPAGGFWLVFQRYAPGDRELDAAVDIFMQFGGPKDHT